MTEQLQVVFEKDNGKIRIIGERGMCPPYMVGTVFRREGNSLWIIEACSPLEGKIQLGLFHLPTPAEELDNGKVDA